jgi:hypothetical protein
MAAHDDYSSWAVLMTSKAIIFAVLLPCGMLLNAP